MSKITVTKIDSVFPQMHPSVFEIDVDADIDSKEEEIELIGEVMRELIKYQVKLLKETSEY